MIESGGILILVVGPSGAGKDTLIKGAREALSEKGRFSFPRRIVTREAVASAEDHLSVDRATFATMRVVGSFALHWDAHGLSYGIPSDIHEDLARGVSVVCNVSRHAVASAVEIFSRVAVIMVDADPQVRANRLTERRREARAEVEKRLQRPHTELPEGVVPVIVNNSGTREEGIAQFLGALDAIVSGQNSRWREVRAALGS